MLKNNNIKCGDILFQYLREENTFNGAVSYSGSAPNDNELMNKINHVGLYIGQNIVIEAIPKKGVIKNTLNRFLTAGRYNIIGTINNQLVIKNALMRIKACIGLPYNDSFDANAKGFYCSELITYAFRHQTGEDYFQLYPMNFKDLTTDQFIPYWIDYYRNLKQTIPQGELGSHPQQLLRQKELFKTILTLEC